MNRVTRLTALRHTLTGLFVGVLLVQTFHSSPIWAEVGPAAPPRSTKKFDAKLLEQCTKELSPKISAATLGIVLSSDDIDEQGIGMGGSGVIVSESGLALTAAHVLDGAGEEVIAIMHPKRHIKAKIVGYIGRGDIGVIQLNEPGPYPFLAMSQADSFAPGTFCLGAGHTTRIDSLRKPPIRFGRILGERKEEAFIDDSGLPADLGRVLISDAPFLPGDSGGPLVNLQGEVIGVHSSIGPDHRENLHVPIWQFRRQWKLLNAGLKRPTAKHKLEEIEITADIEPASRTHIADFRVTVERSWSRVHRNFLRRFDEPLQPSSAFVSQLFLDDRPAALCITVNAEGLVATISSEITGEGKLVCRLGDKDYDAQVVARDDAQNLALLRINHVGVPAIGWSPEDTLAPGSWLVSAGYNGQPLSVGVLSVERRAIPIPVKSGDAHQEHGFLGVELQTSAKDARVGRVIPNSAASKAELASGDVIRAINDQAITRSGELVDTLRRFKIGESVKLDVVRRGEKLTIIAELGQRPDDEQSDEAEFAAWNRTSGGVSHRKTGFPDVITHDGFVAPHQCGGPVFDLAGRAVGINIARVDRTATYAIPASTAQAAIERMVNEAKNAVAK